ncbi:hypothetical protein [Hoyosella subflava]|uniref:Uncharacterized protein n=1 Tax=Hoyosella subflava (strain DSM 45089 / JCM 17490 / NBRC 109087 / DQS3-9A1) TaxID=443218 RepID=F6EQG3_HOYSD|nr:hypothetical protein [Hoyosella subflava]AEF40648.1 hypothetical protein AS9A_2199 [Hoyosella subflava DQS3-9A1]
MIEIVLSGVNGVRLAPIDTQEMTFSRADQRKHQTRCVLGLIAFIASRREADLSLA